VSEVLQAKLALNQLDTQKIQAESQLKQARLQFNSLLGNTLVDDKSNGYELSDQGYFKLSAQKTALVPFPETLPPNLDDLYQKAQNIRPDLRAALQQIQVNKAQLRLAKAQRIPDLQLSAGYLYINAPNPTSPTNSKKLFDGTVLEAGFVVPVFQNQGAEIGKAKTTLLQSKLQLTALHKQIYDDVHTAYTELKAARQNIELYQKKLIPDSADVLHLSQESYEYGKTGLANVILAQQSDQQILQSYLQAVVDYQQAWGDLEKAVGEPLTF
jgi:cobalt-zinc-cadmium efflux system outer membrane protein